MTSVEVHGPTCTLLLPGVAAVSRGIAATQATVRVFGNIDLNLTDSKVPGASNLAMDQGSYLLPSRFGFRSDGQLGSGFAASSWLEAAVVPDTDATASAFTRRSTIGLSSEELGKIRLGRDCTPTFWNVSSFSPFGTVGAGGGSNTIEGWPLGLGRATTQQRASNAAGYFLPPDLGGVYGQFMAAAGEGIDGARCTGGRLGYEAGSLNVAAAFGRTPAASIEAVGQPSRRAYETANLGGTYDFGIRTGIGIGKVYVFRNQQVLGPEQQTSTLVGVAVPAWDCSIKAMFARSVLSMRSVSKADRIARQRAFGYVHALSQGTVHCGTWSRIVNEGDAAYATGDTSPEGRPNGTSSALQIGINHAF
ncbi:porin [Variovorax sp. PvP013]|uniref:porin n=1 Tax=Variovorax sp. PvP013 TaxID=3156435 RepID=UPI003D1D3C16